MGRRLPGVEGPAGGDACSPCDSHGWPRARWAGAPGVGRGRRWLRFPDRHPGTAPCATCDAGPGEREPRRRVARPRHPPRGRAHVLLALADRPAVRRRAGSRDPAAPPRAATRRDEAGPTGTRDASAATNIAVLRACAASTTTLFRMAVTYDGAIATLASASPFALRTPKSDIFQWSLALLFRT